MLGLYLLRIAFRFLSNYLAHKAAWYLVGDLRSRMYDKLQHLDLGFFHDKQTGDLMSRVVNDTRDFELLYAHMIPEMITNLVTFAGVPHHSSYDKLEAGADYLLPDSADSLFRRNFCQESAPFLQGFPEMHG